MMIVIIQHIVTLHKYGHGALIRNFVSRGEKWQEKIVSSFSAIKLCFVINVLNNKTIILFSFAGYSLILANSAAYRLVR